MHRRRHVTWDTSSMNNNTEGLEEHNTRTDFDVTKFDRNAIKGGPASSTYESMIKGIFRPNEQFNMNSSGLPPSFLPQNHRYSSGQSKFQNNRNVNAEQSINSLQPNFLSQTPNNKMNVMTANGPQKVSASAMKRVEEELGRDAIDDSNDNELWKFPLDAELEELIEKNTFDRKPRATSSSYQIYTPKSSREYFSTLNTAPPPSALRSSYTGNYRLGGSLHSTRAYTEPSNTEWSKKNKQLLVDYKDFDSSPLSPYMYQSHPYVQKQDSRIVGSNFVQLTTRPKDSFLEKVDRTLAEIRSSPRY